MVVTYDAKDRIDAITDHVGRVWGYRYDVNGALEFVDNPDGTTRQYLYEDSNLPYALTGITDERGVRYATFEYDSDGRAIASYHGPQTTVLADRVEGVTITYDTDGTRTVTNSNGDPSTYSTAVQLGVALVTDITGPGCSTCGTGNTGYQYDAANNLIGRTENGITTRYGNYDTRGQYGCQVEGISAADTSDNSAGVCNFDPVASPEARRTDYAYDARFFNKITSLTEPSVFPGNSKVTTNTYDAFGNKTSETINGFDPTGNPVSRTTTWQYTGPLN